jgi:hypothetical protein
MAKLEFSPEEIDMYVKDKRQHVFYKDTIVIAEEMETHADGRFPAKLLDERRPNEPQQVLEYRKKIFVPKTKPVFSKIFSSLQKIRRSADWNIRYEGEFPRIAEEETLEDYCEKNYPMFTSLTNWVFTILLRKYLIDPNAVVFVHPETLAVPDNEYIKPVASIFNSKNVVDFREQDFAVLRNPTGARYMSGRNEVIGMSLYFCTINRTLRYDQINGRMQFALVQDYQHNLGYLPVFKVKGVVVEENEGVHLYESRIDAIIPELDEAIREYSDLQAAKVLHIYPERWEFTQNECTTCKGTGHVRNPSWTVDCACPEELPCTNAQCSNGYIVAGPYSKIMVRPVANASIEGIAQIPTPPAGYVEKDVEIVKVMEASIESHIHAALSSINFEFLAKTPLSQSGVAKEVDKDELNNTVHSIAEDIVSVMDNVYRATALYRYNQIYTADEIADMVPVVAVPERFDILTTQHTADDLKQAKLDKANPAIISALEIDYAGSRFNADPEVRERVVLLLKLDPLANISEDDKNSRLQNKGITKQTYIISSNIQAFVTRALEEDAKFAEKDLKDQQALILKYAEEQIAADDEAVNITNQVADTGLDDNGNPIENAPI